MEQIKNKKLYFYLIIIASCLLLYGNTINNKYALDDAIVITQNDFTQKGFSGIIDHLTNESFTGFFKVEKKLVSGGRYRPLSFITFAIEYEFFGESPGISHFVNIVIYILLCILLYKVLCLLLPSEGKHWYTHIPFLACLLFIYHPIHTEVVANIKGRDEMLTFMGALVALYYSIKYLKEKNGQKKKLLLVYSGLAFFLGLMAKENAITFIAIIPLSLYFFTDAKRKQIFITIVPLLISTLLFLYIRYEVVGFTSSEEVKELLNNPFLGLTLSQKAGTILYSLLRYIELLFLPYPLTYDYYPYHVSVTSLISLKPIISILVYAFLGFIAIRSLKTKSVYGFGVIVFLASLSIVSNILFPVGTFMNERFAFIPSFGFVIVIAYFLVRFNTQVGSVKYRYILMSIFVGILILASVETIDRNNNWKDDLTLFTHDVLISSNSAKSTCSAGGKLLEHSKNIGDSLARIDTLLLAKKYLLQSTKNYSLILKNGIYTDAELLLGNCYFELAQYDSTLFHYKKLCRKAPLHDKVYENAIITINKFSDIDKKIQEATSFFHFNPNEYILNYNLGKWYGQYKNNIDTAIYFLQRAVYVKPDSKEAYKDLGVAYGFNREYKNAIAAFKKAVSLDPKDEQIYYNLAISYSYIGDFKVSLDYFGILLQFQPNNEQYKANYQTAVKQYELTKK